ncbi:MAG TPA: CapA family protein, partial [Thermoanaerobaculia bacterium]|nr:CapA family protein [Thermoanaerobaculia bacterium]
MGPYHPPRRAGRQEVLGALLAATTGALLVWGIAGAADPAEGSGEGLTLLLAGDVMLGRGIDQIMKRPLPPRLYEPYVRDARRYVALAEAASGPIPRRVRPAYVWGEALEVLARHRPAVRIVNLETAVTTADEPWPGKGIHYRTHPANVAVLEAAGVDCAGLANNHVLDWGRPGLAETVTTLRRAGIAVAGAGADSTAAAAPAILATPGGRVLVFAMADGSSGVPPAWGAEEGRSGVSRLPDLAAATAREVARTIARARGPGDLVVASIHWGGNWGYAVPPEQARFARILVDEGGVDVVHGHSSHHPKGIEIYRGRLVLYGAGDLINDYEGIGGQE